MFIVILFDLLLVEGRAPPSRPHRDVATTQGVVRGYLTPAPCYAFLGVPYARADRFKAPKPPKQWDGTFEATYKVKCPQPGGEGVEDCLALNIFVPEEAEALPVLVIVHDGAFQYGWGQYQPPVRLLQRFVIVTINYRIGALGFLCLGTESVPGNAGLKDQIAALYWIQKNIEQFGGNPLEVTVYGVGAGAAAVELILLSDLSRGLIHKVILESGSALSPLAVEYDPVLVAFETAAALGYGDNEEGKNENDDNNNDDSEDDDNENDDSEDNDNEDDGNENNGNDDNDNQDVEKLEKFFTDISLKQITKINKLFLPCIDRNYSNGMFEADPIDILTSGIYHKVPMLVVYTDKIVVTKMDEETFTYKPESFENILPNNLEFPMEDVKEKVAQFVKNFYFEQDDTDSDLVRSYIDYFNDITVEYPAIKSAMLHASENTSPVYLMKLTYNSHFENSDPTMDHTLLSYFYAKDDLGGNDEVVAQRLVTLWSNFITIGDPTPLITTLVPVVWPPIHTGQQQDQEAITEVQALECGTSLDVNTAATGQVVFWDNIYKRFYKRHR